MTETKQFTFIRGKERWILVVYPDGKVEITCNGEQREYQIEEPILRVEQDEEYPEYVRMFVEDEEYPEKFYQFKFEENYFLVGDIFYNSDGDDDFIDSFAGWVFGEE